MHDLLHGFQDCREGVHINYYFCLYSFPKLSKWLKRSYIFSGCSTTVVLHYTQIQKLEISILNILADIFNFFVDNKYFCWCIYVCFPHKNLLTSKRNYSKSRYNSGSLHLKDPLSWTHPKSNFPCLFVKVIFIIRPL
jgi:hypothetical protein